VGKLNVGINAVGMYLPTYRLSNKEYQRCWGPLGIDEKVVANYDEDVVTMGVEAAKEAILNSSVKLEDIKGIFVASTNFPYIEKNVASTFIHACGLKNDVYTRIFTGSTQAGTAALLSSIDFVISRGQTALMIVSDMPRGIEGELLGSDFAAGAVAFLVSADKVFIEIAASGTYSLELFGERFRHEEHRYTDDLELRAYHKEGFQKAVVQSASKALEQIDNKAINKAIMPVKSKKEAMRLGKKISLLEQQIWEPIVVRKIGDTGVCTVFLELIKCLAEVKEGALILMVSYGSGACSDALVFKVKTVLGSLPDIERSPHDKLYIDYLTYLKRSKLIGTYKEG